MIGFESLSSANLREMQKPINDLNGGVEYAARELRRYRVPVYGTFVFGFDADQPESLRRTVAFSIEHGFLVAAFAHLMPFPGTPLYVRLASENRLLRERWWLDPDYCYNTVAFRPRHFSPEQLRQHCLDARRAFFSWSSILRRSVAPSNRYPPGNFWMVNLLLRGELGLRDGHPLGDQAWTQPLLRVQTPSLI